MTRTDSTKKKARKIVLILLVLLVALVIGFLVVYSRMDQLGMVPVAREDIPETFRKEVPGNRSIPMSWWRKERSISPAWDITEAEAGGNTPPFPNCRW